jgi:hypothetical protein
MRFDLMSRRLRILAMIFLLCAPGYLRAQDDDDVSLGKFARELRTSRPVRHGEVIDNDNLNRLMDEAESQRLDGKPIFSISPSGIFTAVSPDGSCSLSFDARSVPSASAVYITTDLPQGEMAKLTGPASIHDGELEVSLRNNTGWDLKEVVIGITAVQTQSAPPEYRFATLASVSMEEKLPDFTVLIHLKGNVVAGASGIFRAEVASDFPQSKDWRWEIVSARGIPPAAQFSGLARAPNQAVVAPNSPMLTPHPNTDLQQNTSTNGTITAGPTPNSPTEPTRP